MAAMKLRHAAALALVGWYLMMPPMASDLRPDEAAPLATWGLVESFDSAQACKRALHKYSDEAIKKVQGGSESSTTNSARFVVAEECIASDDPRLKQKRTVPVRFC